MTSATGQTIAPRGAYGYNHRGTIRGLGDIEGTYKVEIAALAPGLAWGPVPSVVPSLAVGDSVLCAQIGTTRGDVVIVGKLPGQAPGAPTIDEIPGLPDALAAKAAAADLTTLTTRVGADETAIGNNATAIGSLATSVTSLGTRMGSAEARLTTDENNIATNTTAISGLGTRLTTDEANITALQAMAVECTSTTRPASPRTMTLIYETDTHNVYLWSGSAWVWVSNTSSPAAQYVASSAANQTLPSASNNAVQYGGTPPLTHADVVASGTGNSIFTFQRSGWWTIDASGRINDSVASARFLQIVSADFLTMYRSINVPSAAAASPVDLALSVTREFSAGDQVSISATAATTTGSVNHTSATLAARTTVSFTWHHP